MAGAAGPLRFSVRKRIKMQIITVAMIGAGNLGAYVVRGLTGTLGDDLWVIAEGERKERLEKDGLIINDKPYTLHVRTPEEAGGADLIIVCVKYHALREILPAVKTIAGPHTLVMSLMNGVDSEEILAEAIPKQQIVHAMIRVVADRDGNRITIQPTGKGMGIHYGQVRDIPDEASLRALDDLFAGAAFDAVRDEDILTSMWSKYAFNNCENLPQAVLDAGVGCFEDSAHMAWVRSMIYEETRMVAAAEGVTLPPEPKHVTSAQFPKHAIYSTLQDLRAGRKTETEMFAGTLLRLAEKHGLQVPYTEMLYHLLCAFEEKNAGLFDYTE